MKGLIIMTNTLPKETNSVISAILRFMEQMEELSAKESILVKEAKKHRNKQ